MSLIASLGALAGGGFDGAVVLELNPRRMKAPGRREQVLHLPGALAILPSFDQRHAVELLAAASR